MIAPSFAISVNGSFVNTNIRKSIIQVNCDLQLAIASEICLVVHDPNYTITDSGLFNVGSELIVKLGFGKFLNTVALGEIISLEPQLSQNKGMMLIVRAYDKSYRLRRSQPDRVAFLSVRDSDIAKQIATDSGLKIDVEQTPTVHEYVQQTGSDWRFLKNKAKANGYDMYVRLDTLVFRRRKTKYHATHSLKRNRELLQLNFRLSAVDQPNLEVVRGWDTQQKQPLVAKTTAATSGITTQQGKLGAEITMSAFGESRTVIYDILLSSQDEAESLSKAAFLNKTRGFITGEGACLGNPDMQAGDTVEILNMGKRFSGLYDLSRVTHVINEDGYRTHFEIERENV